MPIKIVLLVTDQLIAHERVRRAYMGLTLDGHFTLERAKSLGLTQPMGARVTYVQKNSPAALANFQIDDIVLTFDGLKVEDDKHLYNLVSLADIDRKIPITVYRSGNLYTIQIQLTERPSQSR